MKCECWTLKSSMMLDGYHCRRRWEFFSCHRRSSSPKLSRFEEGIHYSQNQIFSTATGSTGTSDERHQRTIAEEWFIMIYELQWDESSERDEWESSGVRASKRTSLAWEKRESDSRVLWFRDAEAAEAAGAAEAAEFTAFASLTPGIAVYNHVAKMEWRVHLFVFLDLNRVIVEKIELDGFPDFRGLFKTNFVSTRVHRRQLCQDSVGAS